LTGLYFPVEHARREETIVLGDQGQLLRSYFLEIPPDGVGSGSHEMYPAVSALGAVVGQFKMYKAVNEWDQGDELREEDFNPLYFGLKNR
jgi:hypothetical protein